jgi:chromosome segregation protein
MFGSRRIQELESRLNDVNDSVEKLTREKGELEQKLSDAVYRASEAEKDSIDAYEKISELEDTHAKLETAAAELDHQLKSEKEKNAALMQDLSDTRSGNSSLQERLDSAGSQITELEENLSAANSNISDLEQSLAAANANISDLEAKLTDTDLEELKEKARVTLVEVEGLRSMYAKKIQEFDETLDEKEELFAKEDAVQRYNLEKEIQDDRQANRDYVSNTVKEFSESFNYYLNQIRMLMDALGDVAARTGTTLFQERDQKLLTSIGEAMVEKIHDEDELDPEGVVLIKNIKEDGNEG